MSAVNDSVSKNIISDFLQIVNQNSKIHSAICKQLYFHDIVGIKENATNVHSLKISETRHGGQMSAAQGSVSNDSIPNSSQNVNNNFKENQKKMVIS